MGLCSYVVLWRGFWLIRRSTSSRSTVLCCVGHVHITILLIACVGVADMHVSSNYQLRPTSGRYFYYFS